MVTGTHYCSVTIRQSMIGSRIDIGIINICPVVLVSLSRTISRVGRRIRVSLDPMWERMVVFYRSKGELHV